MPLPAGYFAPANHPILDRPKVHGVGHAGLTSSAESAFAVATAARPGHDEYGRLIASTADGFKTAADDIRPANTAVPSIHELARGSEGQARSRAMHSQVAHIISHGSFNRQRSPKREDGHSHKLDAGRRDRYGGDAKLQALAEGDSVARHLAMDETTMPGDLLVRKPGIPVQKRMAALIRQRAIDLNRLFIDFLRRSPYSRMPQRGFSCIDVPTLRRCLCYSFGEQWTALGMTSAELLEVSSPHILSDGAPPPHLPRISPAPRPYLGRGTRPTSSRTARRTATSSSTGRSSRPS